MQWTGPSPPQDPNNWDKITYKYDISGRRINKSVDGYKTTYCYDGGHVIAEYDGNGNILRKYVYGPRVDQPVCMIEVADSNAAYYYHFDGLGSVVALSDSAGDTVQTYEYSVYGQVAASDPNHPNPYLFTGRRFDRETGLYYYRARYYNPYIGRFLQTDPVGYGYGYCGNNPLGFVDPFGLFYYGFLDQDHESAVPGQLTFACFNDDGSIRWVNSFDSLEDWRVWDQGRHSRGGSVPLDQQAGYGLAGGDEAFDRELFWDIRTMIYLGYDESKIELIESYGVSIDNTSVKNYYEDGTIYWNPSGDIWGDDWDEVGDPPYWFGFPALAILAHECEHAYQDFEDGPGGLAGYDVGNEIAQWAEQGAMQAENLIAYAFYTKVPGYGPGGINEIVGPRTYYSVTGYSKMWPYPAYTTLAMSWDDWSEDFVPEY